MNSGSSAVSIKLVSLNSVSVGLLRTYAFFVTVIAILVAQNGIQAYSSSETIPKLFASSGSDFRSIEAVDDVTQSRSMGLQLNSPELGKLKTELCLLAVMATGLISLSRRYRRQPKEDNLSVSGFYAD